MSPNLQPDLQLDLHPDSEALNAFAEQALPELEREQILAHTAECSRCRQILFLAQIAAEPAAMASESNVLPFQLSKTQKIPIAFSNWRFAGIAAAAALALASLSLFLLPKHTQPAPQVAKQEAPGAATPPQQTVSNSPQPLKPAETPPPAHPLAAQKPALRQQLAIAPPNTPRPANGIFALRDSARVAAPAPPPFRQSADAVSAASPVGSATAAQPPLPARASDQALPLPSSATETVTVEAAAASLDAPLPPITGTIAEQKATRVPNPDPNPPQLQIELGASQVALAPDPTRKQRASGGSLAKSAKGAGSAQAAGASYGTLGGISPANARGLDHPFASSISSAGAKADSEAARLALHTTLPSGSTAASTVAAQHHLLAIDNLGSLFLSEDSGKTWQPIARQWTGRATQLRLPPTQAVKPETVVAGSSPTAPLPPVPLFELVTDTSAIWASADGKTWTAK